jgi:hypothetical protein
MRRFALLALLIGGCAFGAPASYSSGEAWTVPLVGPLEDGVLVVPVFVNERGPYLFAIDPDAKVSSIDQLLVGEADIHTFNGARLRDEQDTTHPTFYADVRALRIGTLVVSRQALMISRPGAFNVNGRVVRGLIGRDVLMDSTSFAFDRDRGLAYITTQAAFKPPADAIALKYDQTSERVYHELVPRRLISAVVDGVKYSMHLDLGAGASQLRGALWEKTRLATIPVQTPMVDETGTGRLATRGAIAGKVSAGAVTRDGVFFVDYGERRWDESAVDGALGLNFFQPYAVWANWDKQTFYLAPRHDDEATLKARLGRWGNSQVTTCASPGCVALSVIDPLAGQAAAPPPAAAEPVGGPPAAPGAPGEAAPATREPPLTPPSSTPKIHPGVMVIATRDPAAAGYDLELLVEAVLPGGEPARRLAINLPAGVDRVMEHLPAAFVGVKLRVLDVSPFPRACQSGGGCVYQIAASR